MVLPLQISGLVELGMNVCSTLPAGLVKLALVGPWIVKSRFVVARARVSSMSRCSLRTADTTSPAAKDLYGVDGFGLVSGNGVRAGALRKN